VSEDSPDPAADLAAAQKRMRRRMLAGLGITALAVGLSVGLFAWCNRPGPEVPPIARPHLWEVVTPGGTSHLFGTLHIGYSVDDLPGPVLAAQERALTTVTESDLLSEKPRVAVEHGRARLEDDAWRRLSAITGVPEENLVTAQTSMLVGALIRAVAPPVEPMDRGLQSRAKKLGKRQVFLEERSLEQLMPSGELLSGLAVAVRHPSQLRAQLLEMVRGYATGDDKACAGSGTLVEDLNQTWTIAIENEVARGPAFVAIGCSHLAGVIGHLREKGFEVRRVAR
jgi:uncharacterized protein YbaP (TraB family)